MNRPRFWLYGNGGDDNRGCQAIRIATTKILSDSFDNAELIYTPFVLKNKMIGVDLAVGEKINYLPQYHPAYKKWSAPWCVHKFRFEILKQYGIPRPEKIEKISALLSLGGDNISLDYGRPPEVHFKAHRIAKKASVPLVLWGASVGPFDKLTKRVEQYCLDEVRKIDLICARETLSYEYLASHGMEDRLCLVSDPAFLLPIEQPEQLPANVEHMLQEGCIGLNLSNLLGNYLDSPGQWPELAVEYCKKLLKTSDRPVLLIPHVVTPDTRFMSRMLEAIDAPPERLALLDATRLNASEIKGVLSRLHFFIGARTHATIGSLSACVPTLSLAYSIKAKGINHDIFGHSDWVQSIRDLDLKSFEAMIRQLLEQRDSIADYLKKMMPDYSKRASHGVERLKALLH
jgi:colanic acid/amylovoran biosynthesis protein WcaK/AmsJ